MSGSDKDGGPSGPRRHGLKLVRQSETWMSERMLSGPPSGVGWQGFGS
jgi:hypothetical protein